ncbi:DNA-binding transcriptional regulator, AcrR family [Saccharopolyspora antimicrobica]|uniref:DNA-binding transcriptional regulator, AcrR family n=1 Tax=Saccharopolyspora antimicrobica TaxID=455193 RepID=A0A1I5IML1_9PSEU|nr:TetR/AcrR family transcriptional regulator [Saccharopolyspora antimicrobica]RKT84054.1 TetR family transcriptional regulator [Saccharopolyspora antimicrobica]SFO61692.1 DNA-binding transcriptional regulator, AcrR family [Saccharopolyspora antimicrobica]
MTERDTGRRSELLAKLLDYSATHGLSEVSLRPLAAAVGSSPRMLLYFFGSKEGLVREVHRHARDVQLQLLADTLADCHDRTEALRGLWHWLSSAAHHDVIRFFFESYARSLRGGAWEGFGEASVREWLPPLQRALGGSEAEATLVLAALRGLVLDLLATGDAARVDSAFEALLANM